MPYVVFGVYYILIPICHCFCWFTVLQHACEWSVTAFFWKKYSKKFIHASPNASKNQICLTLCHTPRYKKKKHAKNLRDLLWNLWAVSSLVNLPKKAKIHPGRRMQNTAYTLAGKGITCITKEALCFDTDMHIITKQKTLYVDTAYYDVIAYEKSKPTTSYFVK